MRDPENATVTLESGLLVAQPTLEPRRGKGEQGRQTAPHSEE